MSLPKSRMDLLGSIRDMEELQLAYEEDLIWIKGFIYEEISSAKIRKITHSLLYTEKDGWLYALGSRLRDRRMPALLFTPIQRAIPLEIECYNHNLFEINNKAHVALVPGETEQKAVAHWIDLSELTHFVEQSPSFRFAHVQWCLVDGKALVLGDPMLPIGGAALWKFHNSLLPLGFQLELPSLHPVIFSFLSISNIDLLLWTGNKRIGLKSTWFKPLTRASLRATKRKFLS